MLFWAARSLRPKGVNRVVLPVRRSLPVYPDERTIFGVRRHVSKVPLTAVIRTNDLTELPPLDGVA